MRRPAGSRVYFIKDFRDNPRPDNLVRQEGTFYFERNYPMEKESEVKIGQVTQRRGEISLPYYEHFLTFTKMEMWGGNIAPNSTKARRLSPLESQVKTEGYKKMIFKTNKEAREFYNILKDNNIRCTLSGNFIIDIERMGLAETLLKEVRNKDIDRDFNIDINIDDSSDDNILI